MIIDQNTAGDDFVFDASGSVFSLAIGDRMCFNVTIVDDEEIEYDQSFGFSFYALNQSLQYQHFYDYTRIRIRDNDGELCQLIKSLL